MLDYPIDTPRKRKIPKAVLYVIFWALVILVGRKAFFGPGGTILSPLPDEPHTSFVSSLFSKSKNPDDLKRRVQEAAKGWVNYSVVVADFNTSLRMEINDTMIYTAASVNKLPILTALYHAAEAGDIDLDDTITLQANDILNYGTGTMQYDPPGTTYAIKTVAQLMIKHSDNTAASILTHNIVGEQTIQSYVNSLGLTQTDITNNKTSNRDIALLLRKLYEGELANQANTQEMLGFMKDTDFEDRLPALLPDGVTVYHKIGTETRVIHDVGIITDGTRTYYLGVFLGDVTDEAAAVSTIANISKIVWDFMQ